MAYCDRCDRRFVSDYAYDAHRRDSSNHYVCFPCDRDFQAHHQLEQHLTQSSKHNYCPFCDKDFDDEDELSEHDEQCHEYCDPCGQWFDTVSDMVEHNKDEHFYCVECDRCFTSLSNLQSHLNSSTHRPRNISCPGTGCDDWFVSKSALLLHFEGGKCKSGLTRQSLNRLIAGRDKHNFITITNQLIKGTTETWATRRAWNGSAYECYLCHKEFYSLPQLNQHLGSAVHEKPLYHCPKLGHGCQAQFKSASALCQHIEDGACGVTRFKIVQDNMNKLIRGVNRIA